MNYQLIRSQVLEGFKLKFGREATRSEAQFLQAIGMLETSCGTGWKGVGAGSFNMGAITAGPAWKGATFEYKDSYPDKDGVDHWYVTKFRKYASAVEGWADLANIMYEDRPSVFKAATAGDIYGVSSALYETKYYAGRGKDARERIAGHHAAVLKNLNIICRMLNEPLPSGEPLEHRTLRRGDVGEDVKVVQRWLGLTVDGIFGPVMGEAVIAFQRRRQLAADGVIGPKTMDALEAAYVVPTTDTTKVIVELTAENADLKAKLEECKNKLGACVSSSQTAKP